MKLYDPQNLGGEETSFLEKKIQKALMALALSYDHHGHPLLYSIAAGKIHMLSNIGTAATNGRMFFWDKKFLSELSDAQTLVVLKHEALHIALFHCDSMYKCDRPRVMNKAMDFIVNSMIERDWRHVQKTAHVTYNPDNHPIWCYPLGKPLSLENLKNLFHEDKQALLNNINGEIDKIFKKQKEKNKKEYNIPNNNSEDIEKVEEEEEKSPDECSCDVKKDRFCMVDLSLLNRSSKSIYDELNELYNGLDSELHDLFNGLQFDEHMTSDRTEKEALESLLKAIGFAKSTRGSVPGEIESLLSEIYDPTLNLSEFINHTIKNKKINGGMKANYTQFKRRFLSDEYYYPKYSKDIAKILVLLDTSGSMSDEDIAYGVAELKQFIGNAEIFIVPTDAEPHWDKLTKVTKEKDFATVKVFGRGGTMFADFFKNYNEKVGRHGPFCSILVITDGYTDIVPMEYKPRCQVGWIYTNDSAKFEQNFGKVVRLK